MDTKERIKKIFGESSLEAILLINSPNQTPNFKYVTQFTKGMFEHSALVVKRGEYTLILPGELEYETARMQTKEEIIKTNFSKLFPKIKEEIRDFKEVGIAESETSLADYKKIRSGKKRFVDATMLLERARLTKEPYEIKKIRKAADTVSRICDEIKDYNFKTESELAAQIEFEMKKRGSEKPSFDTIIASGPNSALPHYTAGQREIKEGDFIVVDFGATIEGYVSDITRTFFYKKASNKQKELYNLVKGIQEKALQKTKAGIKFHDIHQVFVDGVKTATGKDPIHGIGHPIGLEVHDTPNLMLKSFWTKKKENQERFLPEMTITIEPGIYKTGFGGVRIEDDVLLTREGCEILTSAKKELKDMII